MASGTELSPKDLVPTIEILLRHHRGEWVSPERLWQWIIDADPDLADRVRVKVKGYKDPPRNNEVWFLSNSLYHLDKTYFQISNVEATPEVKGGALWLIARAS